MEHIINIIAGKWVIFAMFIWLVLFAKSYGSKSMFQKHPKKWLENQYVQIVTLFFAVYLIIIFTLNFLGILDTLW